MPRYLIVPVLIFFTNLILTPFVRSAHAETCPFAPFSIITVKDAAVVAPGVDGLNMRFLPAVGTGVVATIHHGYPLTIVGGPSCNGLYTWWQVQTPTGVTGWVAEGTWEKYFIIPSELPIPVEGDEPPTPFEWSCLRHFEAHLCV